MKVWVNTSFEGHYPVGTAAVVVANSAEEAASLLNAELLYRGLEATAEAEDFERVPTSKPYVNILLDGDY